MTVSNTPALIISVIALGLSAYFSWGQIRSMRRGTSVPVAIDVFSKEFVRVEFQRLEITVVDQIGNHEPSGGFAGLPRTVACRRVQRRSSLRFAWHLCRVRAHRWNARLVHPQLSHPTHLVHPGTAYPGRAGLTRCTIFGLSGGSGVSRSSPNPRTAGPKIGLHQMPHRVPLQTPSAKDA